jgi:tRNA pseudouridine38-40 synthase
LSSNVLHLNKKINISKIKSTFKYIKGEKDFSCFRASGCSSKSPIKNIKSLKINSYKNFLYIDITANSFLYHMVRNIVGTLIDVGTSKYESNHVIELISSRDRKKCGKMVLPNGLYLKNITYPKKYNLNSEDIFPYF